MIRRYTAPLAGACILALAFGTASAEHLTESKSYQVGAVGDVTVLNCDSGDELENTGGACFDLSEEPISLSIDINDLSGLKVGGFYQFLDAAGEPVTSGDFCDAKANLTVPAGAVRLVVFIDGAAYGLLFSGCLGQLSTGIGTNGSIKIDYTYL